MAHHPLSMRLRSHSGLTVWAIFLSGLLPFTLLTASVGRADATGQDQAQDRAQGVSHARLAGAAGDKSNWLTHGGTWSEQRFSPVDSLHAENVDQLALAWSFETGTFRGIEATPLVIDGVLYATGSWSVVYALNAVTGEELWTYDPKVPRAKGRDACCDVINRGVAAWGNRIFFGTIDGRLVALDAASGEKVWEVRTAPFDKPYTITGAPRVVAGNVIIGNGGAEFGVRGYFSAYDAETGKMAWRFYTVPASSEGPHEHPELEEAAKTWAPNSMWESGLGGTVWDSMAYDPELDLLYIGTGNSSVYNKSLRSPGGGDNLFLASILAIDPHSGRLVWHYQVNPGEQWDFTATQHLLLADLTIDGETRKVLMQAPKNGFFYVLDRATGELLSADPYVPVSWAKRVDLQTGRPVERPEASWSSAPAAVTPGIEGGHNWHPMAFSPRTGLVYIPAFEGMYIYHPLPGYEFLPFSTFNTGEDWPASVVDVEGLENLARMNNTTRLIAWDPVERRAVWKVTHGDRAIPAGVLATAGDLVFQGRTDGRLVAYDARSGVILWSAPTGTGVMAAPVAYEIDGEAYVVVAAGLGGSQGGHFTSLENRNEGRILAFKIGGNAKLPPNEELSPAVVDAPVIEASAETIEHGRSLYAYHCSRCHGMNAVSSRLYPDLRYTLAGVHEVWDKVVLEGAFENRGMASFADLLDADDSHAIQAYVTKRAHESQGQTQALLDWLGGRVVIPVEWLVD
jgi:quinohemoprotein ethanol dehydrogenase